VELFVVVTVLRMVIINDLVLSLRKRLRTIPMVITLGFKLARLHRRLAVVPTVTLRDIIAGLVLSLRRI
tara:strand:- start:305 stop:511 length:207 start_codon:yes stop_codon:yes gene_type:complete